MRLTTPTLFAGMLALASGVFAQDPSAPPPPPPPAAGAAGSLQDLPPLEQLVAPVALYPDPILALMLPAAAYPDQIQAVAGNPAGADDPSVDPSVQGLAHYPDIVQWMTANLDWTQQLGGAFAGSPTEVMSAIQVLRQQARAAGTLVPSNYEQISVDADGQIEILPAQPDAISIPTYDPSVVYWAAPSGYNGSYFGWSQPYPVGAWLTFDFDWGRHGLWQGDWYSYRRDHGGWNHPIDFAHGNVAASLQRSRAWRPPSHPPASPLGRGPGHFFGHAAAIAQPRPAGAMTDRGAMRGQPVPPRAQTVQPAEGRRPPSAAIEERRTPEEPRSRPQLPVRTEPERPQFEGRPIPTRPAPEHPVPVRPAPERPVPVRPAPERPVPTRSEAPRPVEQSHAVAHPQSARPQSAPAERRPEPSNDKDKDKDK